MSTVALKEFRAHLFGKLSYKQHITSRVTDASERDQAVAVESHRYFAMCRLCGERFRSCVFLPCRHILFCWNCGQHFRRCDECQLDIVRRMHVDMGRSLPKEE